MGNRQMNNAGLLAWLIYGEGYKTGVGAWFIAGSRAEGLAVEQNWGHKSTDMDRMKLHGGPLGVHVSKLETPAGAATLEYWPKDCPEAYCKLKVKNSSALKQHLSMIGHLDSKDIVSKCIVTDHADQWLHIRKLLGVLLPRYTENISGPAGNKYGIDWDMVPALICSAPHPDLKRFCQQRRERCWPTAHQLEVFMAFPMLLVLTGSKGSSRFHLEARVSWSHHELILMACLPMWIKQGYVAFKYTLKGLLSSCRGKSELPPTGRSVVSSYHLKTTLLHHLDENPPRSDGCPFHLVLDLLSRLQQFLQNRKQPHFFMPECDLLRTVSGKEYGCALRAIKLFCKDPVKAVLQSPIKPREIYGDVRKDFLSDVFCRLSTCQDKQTLDDVQNVYRRLDSHREQCHQSQLKQDQTKGVTQRPKPEQLAERLSLIKPSWIYWQQWMDRCTYDIVLWTDI